MNKSSTKPKQASRISNGKSTKYSSSRKLIRDLRNEYDKFQPIYENSPLNKLQNKQQQQDYNIQIEQQNQDQLRNSNSCAEETFKNTSKQKQITKHSGIRLKQNKPKTCTNSSQLMHTIPKSYLIAMQHLQDLIEAKNQQIENLKITLMQKQQTILDTQSRVNQILIKYRSLSDMYSLKESEAIVLKQQMQQLRNEKQTALKQAARAMEPEFKINSSVQIGFSTFKQRSVSTNGLDYKQPNNSYIHSKQLLNTDAKNILLRSRRDQTDIDKVASSLLLTRNLGNSLSKNIIPLIHSSKDKNYVSYQRQIIRNEKQLIALKYRMECLQRKLSSDPKQDSIKQRIRTLSVEIQQKQKTINELKRI